MSAKHCLLVAFDGQVTRIEPSGGLWVVHGERFFQSAGYACQHMGDDHQEGARVYVERPRRLWELDCDAAQARATAEP